MYKPQAVSTPLEDLALEAAAVRTGPRSDRALGTSRLADALERELCSPGVLEEVAHGVLRVAIEVEADALLAASPLAERIVGATVIASGGRLNVHHREIPSNRILAVDTILFSGTQLDRAVRAARQDASVTMMAVLRTGPVVRVDRTVILAP